MTELTALRAGGLGWRGRVALAAAIAPAIALSTSDAFTFFFVVTYAIPAVLLLNRQPRNGVGWFLVVFAYGFMGTTSPVGKDVATLLGGTASPAVWARAWFSGWAGHGSFASLGLLAIVFPTGRFPRGRWRLPALALVATSWAVVALAALGPTLAFNPDGGVTSVFVPNPVPLLAWVPIWSVVPADALIVPTVVLLGLAVASMIVRYRRATGVLKLQLRWLVASITFVVVAVAAGLSTILVFPKGIGGLAWIPAVVAYPTVPASIAVAVLRYRLFEIDRIVSRTIGWALVSAILVASFVLPVLVLQGLLAGVTQGDTLAVAASTLVAFALFQPVRRRVQGAVDRRFDRGRVDAATTVADFTDDLRGSIALGAVTEALEGATVILRPAHAAVWLRADGAVER